ncbi:MAG: hypothetical protein IH604_03160 [Burkholderiales bacterium]|nr:hypothetical protein [Burkholderiales bacterium]
MSAKISVKANAGAARVTPKLKSPIFSGAARMSAKISVKANAGADRVMPKLKSPIFAGAAGMNAKAKAWHAQS